MTLKIKLLAATATLALSAASVSANEVRFVQSSQATSPASAASIANIVFNQTAAKTNKIGKAGDSFVVVGSLTDLVIKQVGDNNQALMDVYTSNSGNGTIDMDFNGDLNVFDMQYGASGDTVFSTIDIDIDVDGDSNTFAEVIAQTSGAFIYDAKVDGSTNAIDTTSGGSVATLDIDYDIVGDNNFLTVDTGFTGGDRDLDVDITGSSNNWTINAQSSTQSIVNVKQTGDGVVTGIINHTGGDDSNMQLILAASAGAFNLTTNDVSSASSATINLTTLGAGAFDLKQSTDNSVYNVSMTLAAGAVVDVNM